MDAALRIQIADCRLHQFWVIGGPIATVGSAKGCLQPLLGQSVLLFPRRRVPTRVKIPLVQHLPLAAAAQPDPGRHCLVDTLVLKMIYVWDLPR